jgi:putative endonuclease
MKGFFVSNMFYFYIIKSLSKGIYYKGVSEDFQRRLEQHNSGLSKFTSTAMHWELVYVEKHETKRTTAKLIRKKTDF